MEFRVFDRTEGFDDLFFGHDGHVPHCGEARTNLHYVHR